MLGALMFAQGSCQPGLMQCWCSWLHKRGKDILSAGTCLSWHCRWHAATLHSVQLQTQLVQMVAFAHLLRRRFTIDGVHEWSDTSFASFAAWLRRPAGAVDMDRREPRPGLLGRGGPARRHRAQDRPGRATPAQEHNSKA